MKRLLFLVSLLVGLALILAQIDAPRVDAQTFPGQPSPQYLPIGQGAAPIKWLPITGCSLTSPASLTCPYTSGTVPWANITSPPTTLAGYGITNARTQATAGPVFYVNGNSGGTAACGPTGASTCAAGVNSAACLSVSGNTPATACLTLQYVVNYLIASVDLASFGPTVYLAHNTGTANYALSCQNGPNLGTSVIDIEGDGSAKTAVVIQPASGSGNIAISVKDLCTVRIANVAFADNATNNSGGYLFAGLGSYGHIDVFGVTFGACNTSCVSVEVTYGGSLTFTDSTSQSTGSKGFELFVHDGGVVDYAGNTFAGGASITYATAFVDIIRGGIVNATTSTFTGFSSVSGPRCIIVGPWTFNAANPNKIFPGSSDCVADSMVGALGIQTGSGASSSLAYGNTGQCLTSGGGSSSLNTWANCSGSGVPQNNLNTQSGNYTIQTTDCGNTINETGAMKTITLPSVAGFATNCVLSVYNASSTRGQLLSGFPGALSAAPNNVLWMLDTVTVEIVNGAWSIQSYPVRHKLTASITVNVDNTNGNDANDCLSTTTSACKTIQGALNYIGTWDGNTQAITVSVADGTYTNAVTVNGPFHGNPTVTLQGDLATPANCVISTTSATAITVTNGATLTIGGFKITTATSGGAISVANASFLTISGAMEYGASAGIQILSQNASTISITANYTISGGAVRHYTALSTSTISVSAITVTVTGTPAFSASFAGVANEGYLSVSGSITFSGSATGTRYTASLQGVINIGTAASATFFPGNAAGTVATHGFIDGPGTPGVSSCGGSPGAATGTDFSGHVVEGSTATGCTITFTTGSTFNSCTVSLSTGAAVGVSTLGATLVVVHASLSGNTLYWTCAN